MREETENLSESDKKVRQMLGSLKQVEAPKDFEFRVKARLANADRRAYRTNYKKRFAYILPASAFALVSGFMLLNGSFSSGANDANPLAENTVQAGFTISTQNSPDELVAANTIANKEPVPIVPVNSNTQIRNYEKVNPSFVANESFDKTKPRIRTELPKENSGGSKVTASTGTEVFTPRNLNPNAKIEIPKDFNVEKDFSIREIMSSFGVEVISESGRWKVKNVVPNSAAERSGIKADDEIETLDGRRLSGETLKGKKIEVKKLGVRRGGASVEINLQANPQ